MTTAAQKAEARAATAHHTIVSVAFTEAAARGLPSSAARLDCTCGETVTSGTWSEHRGVVTAAWNFSTGEQR